MTKTHILLVNLGSPKAPNKKAIRKYLKQFLSDKRVVDLPRWLWLPILNLIILNIRPSKLVKPYQLIWGKTDDSPLVDTCKKIANKINLPDNCSITAAMCYGEPSIKSALAKVKNIDNLIVLPMFPQYSSVTTAAIFDAIHRFYNNVRTIPNIKFVNNYHDNVHYINALAKSISNHWQQNQRADKLIISFHGIPKRFVDTGDIYLQHCQNTAQLLANKLSLASSEWQLTFQSRFGKAPWLEPYTDATLTQLPKQGIKSVDVISPGFSADCLETLEELSSAGKEIFLSAGGKSFNYITALNDSISHIKMWQNLALDNLNTSN